jgi:hypothetical protein
LRGLFPRRGRYFALTEFSAVWAYTPKIWKTVQELFIDLKSFRKLRNHFEHFDERLDVWVADYNGHPFLT